MLGRGGVVGARRRGRALVDGGLEAVEAEAAGEGVPPFVREAPVGVAAEGEAGEAMLDEVPRGELADGGVVLPDGADEAALGRGFAGQVGDGTSGVRERLGDGGVGNARDEAVEGGKARGRREVLAFEHGQRPVVMRLRKGADAFADLSAPGAMPLDVDANPFHVR